MTRLSARDRFFSPPVARAIVSPSAILALVAGVIVGLWLGGALAAIGLGLLAYVGRVALALPRSGRAERIDPFTLSEPWRHYVRDALQAHARFQDAVRGARPGPTQERLREIDERVATGVEEVWRIARRGNSLGDARRRLDAPAIGRRIAALEAHPGPAQAQTLESLQAQLASATRLERVVSDADSQLRLLNARLDEAAARTIELAVQAAQLDRLGSLGDDVDHVVDEMEALRLAIEETEGGGALGTGAG
jgi:hypothetical protein